MFNKIYDGFKKFIKDTYKGIIFIIIFAIIVNYKLPYLVYKPGDAIRLNNRINIDGEDNKISGTYNMNSVSVVRGTIPVLLLSKVIPNWDIYSESDLIGKNTDYETAFKLEQIDLKSSFFLATYNAYKIAGKTVDITNSVNYIDYINENADTNLKVMDKIISVDGNKLKSLNEMQKYIESLNVGDKVNFIVEENKKEVSKYAYVKDFGGYKKVGMSILTDYEYTALPDIEIKSKSSEAGSSGGMMLTLTIYDKLVKEDLSHGKNIMGTGTIDFEGNIGAIGGVKYKLLGAENNHADIFFIAKDNYDEAKKVYDKYKLSFKLVKVENINDAINYLSELE